MPVLMSIAKWFDPCTYIKSEKLGGTLIKSDPIAQGWQWLETQIWDLTSFMLGSLGCRVEERKTEKEV